MKRDLLSLVNEMITYATHKENQKPVPFSPQTQTNRRKMSLDLHLTVNEDNDESKNGLVKKLLDGAINKLVKEIPFSLTVEFDQLELPYLFQQLWTESLHSWSRFAGPPQNTIGHFLAGKSYDGRCVHWHRLISADAGPLF